MTVLIRPAVEQDIPALYDLAAARGTAWARLSRGAAPPPEQFAATITYGVVHHVVAERVDGAIGGYAGLYDFAPEAGWISLEATVLDTFEDPRGALLDAAIHSAFDHYGVSRISAIHHAFEPAPFEHLGVPWVEEGRLIGCYLHDDRYWDRIYTALTRTAWLGSTAPDDSDAAVGTVR